VHVLLHCSPNPDIAAQATHHDLPLDWVGMAGIALPLQLAGQALTAQADIGVSLDDPGARGVHMSRLYLALQSLAGRALGVPALQRLLDDCLGSHRELSDSASLPLHRALRQLPEVDAFRLRVVHAESLHAHDAVAESRWNWRR
jgi:GTP cyclohydrolase I